MKANLMLSWLSYAEMALVVATLVLLALARQLERARATVGAVMAAGAASAITFGVLETDSAARFALVVAGGALVTCALLLPRAELFDEAQVPEAGALALVGTLGAVVLSTAASLIEVALGVELISLSAATLVGLGRGMRPLEGAYKYFLLTTITFATLLFGMGLVFVGSGTLDLPNLASVSASGRPLVVAGVALMTVGLLFKLAAAPVHFGSLDAYSTGPSSFVGFIMVVSKLGAAVALTHIAAQTNSAVHSALAIVGVVTIAIGVAASFVQRDLRRLLAYSAVAHAGFLVLAAGAAQNGGLVAARFYVVGYAPAALLAFACLAGTGTDVLPLSRLKSLGRLRAAGLLVALFSLAGVPPLPGFWAKLAVLQATWGAFGLLPTGAAALLGVIGVIYYLRPTPDLVTRTRKSRPSSGFGLGDVVIVALIGLTVLLGLWPGLAQWLVAA
jgi:NADH-quinone oxidoreductase subunit N